jgi:hypothetical protein
MSWLTSRKIRLQKWSIVVAVVIAFSIAGIRSWGAAADNKISTKLAQVRANSKSDMQFITRLFGKPTRAYSGAEYNASVRKQIATSYEPAPDPTVAETVHEYNLVPNLLLFFFNKQGRVEGTYWGKT